MRASIHELGPVLILAATACAAPDAVQLSPFAEGVVVMGRVLENVTACTVDADCYLRIEFADTTISALYGTGDRIGLPCTIPAGVSAEGFEAASGELVDAIISRCESGERYLRSIERR
jgi:hypothetical protein